MGNGLRFSIQSKVILTLLLLTLTSVAITAWWLHQRAARSFDEDLGNRLVAIAQSAAVQFDGSILAQFVPDDQSRTYRWLQNRLQKLQGATGAARLYLFDRELASIADTEPGVPPGSEYLRLRLDRFELEQVWRGEGVASVRFQGVDGRQYKSGYAPIYDESQVVAAVGVDMSALFLDTLHAWQRQFWILLSVIALCVTLFGVLLARRITNPVHQLVRAARVIRDGELKQGISVASSDELGYLARTMDEMRESILERDAQLKLMLANVAHEIRNPLAGIELFAGLVAEDLPPEAPSQAHLSRIRNESRNLNRIITEFLEFARPLPQQPRRVNLQILLDDLSFLILGDLENGDIRYEVHAPDVALHVDAEQIKRALLNVLRNAIQAMPDGGILTVSANVEDERLSLRIEDTGIGIAEEDMDKLFDPFFTTKEKGAGLGLAIVKRNIEQNGGKVTLHSIQGQGTTVSIQLPLARTEGSDVPDRTDRR